MSPRPEAPWLRRRGGNWQGVSCAGKPPHVGVPEGRARWPLLTTWTSLALLRGQGAERSFYYAPDRSVVTRLPTLFFAFKDARSRMDVASMPDIALDGGGERGGMAVEVEFIGMGGLADDKEEAINLEGVASTCHHLLAHTSPGCRGGRGEGRG